MCKCENIFGGSGAGPGDRGGKSRSGPGSANVPGTLSTHTKVVAHQSYPKVTVVGLVLVSDSDDEPGLGCSQARLSSWRPTVEFRDEQVQGINLPVNVQADGALRHACMSTTSLQRLPIPNCRDVSGRTPGQPAIPARLGNADLPITELPKRQKQAQAMQAYAASAPRGRGNHAVETSHQKNVFMLGWRARTTLLIVE